MSTSRAGFEQFAPLRVVEHEDALDDHEARRWVERSGEVQHGVE
jgi:hypothetical protein